MSNTTATRVEGRDSKIEISTEGGSTNSIKTLPIEGGDKSNDRIIAVYGTLKRGYGNHRLVRECTFLGEDFVPFNKITGTGFPIAKFEGADKSKLLKIELYQVHTTEQLASLDSLEGHPTWYRRTPVTTEKGIVAEIYDMFSRDFEDDSLQFAIPNTDNRFEWTRLNY